MKGPIFRYARSQRESNDGLNFSTPETAVL
jgi:hypothetical protein